MAPKIEKNPFPRMEVTWAEMEYQDNGDGKLGKDDRFVVTFTTRTTSESKYGLDIKGGQIKRIYTVGSDIDRWGKKERTEDNAIRRFLGLKEDNREYDDHIKRLLHLDPGTDLRSVQIASRDIERHIFHMEVITAGVSGLIYAYVEPLVSREGHEDEYIPQLGGVEMDPSVNKTDNNLSRKGLQKMIEMVEKIKKGSKETNINLDEKWKKELMEKIYTLSLLIALRRVQECGRKERLNLDNWLLGKTGSGGQCKCGEEEMRGLIRDVRKFSSGAGLKKLNSAWYRYTVGVEGGRTEDVLKKFVRYWGDNCSGKQAKELSKLLGLLLRRK